MSVSKQHEMEPVPASETEAELEAFRQQWREEVSSRNKKSEAETLSARVAYKKLDRSRGAPAPAHATAGPSTARTYNEELEPKTYHDLPDKEEQLQLGVAGQDHDRDVYGEPSSALEHYERAVEKETQGNLGESMRHYRKAFKLDDGVHEAYKRKHFPPSSFVKPKPNNANPPNAPVTLHRTDHHSLHGSAEALPATLKQLVDTFSNLRIEAPPPPTDASPPEKCPIAELPDEIMANILTELAVSDVASFARTAQVCKRLAYLVLTEDFIWKRVAQGEEFGFSAMLYDYAVEVEGDQITASDEIARYLGTYEDDDPDKVLPPTLEERAIAFSTLTEQLLRTTYANSWRQMFRSRPRLRFNGCYISTVNYTRAGANSTNSLTWGAPVYIVTYFRYLRFFRDGSAISLLTTSEPADVVHHLTKQNIHNHHGNYLPSSVMKDALRGRWRLSGPHSGLLDEKTGEPEIEGDVYVETEGVVPKYTYKMHLALASAGKTTRNNKLAWKGFWSHNKLTDDWGEFTLRNDKAFYWSRVRSYGTGLQN